MVRTGARTNRLLGLLVQSGFKPVSTKPRAPRSHELRPDLIVDLVDLYHELGGILDNPTLRPGGWDLAFEDGLVVELDEQLHFNRYRASTLSRGWSRQLPMTDDYLSYSSNYEALCLADGRWGKRWTNPSCERLFGAPDPPGVLGSLGSPRWKQRALYDATKDAFALSADLRVARLAIYDEVEGVELGSVLEGQENVDTQALGRLLESRLVA